MTQIRSNSNDRGIVGYTLHVVPSDGDFKIDYWNSVLCRAGTLTVVCPNPHLKKSKPPQVYGRFAINNRRSLHDAIGGLCASLEGLTARQKQRFRNECDATFDIGLRIRPGFIVSSFKIPSEHLSCLARYRVSVEITVYPPAQD